MPPDQRLLQRLLWPAPHGKSATTCSRRRRLGRLGRPCALREVVIRTDSAVGRDGPGPDRACRGPPLAAPAPQGAAGGMGVPLRRSVPMRLPVAARAPGGTSSRDTRTGVAAGGSPARRDPARRDPVAAVTRLAIRPAGWVAGRALGGRAAGGACAAGRHSPTGGAMLADSDRRCWVDCGEAWSRGAACHPLVAGRADIQ
jgi:hypothetical protein